MSEPLAFTFGDDGAIPNSRLPLLVYRDAVPADAANIEDIFAAPPRRVGPGRMNRRGWMPQKPST